MDTHLSEIFLPGNGISRNIKSRVLQSPLAGVSDSIFRSLVRKWAPEALLFTEMVNAKSLELGYGREKLQEIAQENGPIGVQIFDCRPEAMSIAAKQAEEAGAFIIDINMGCPVKKIASKGGGSGLLKDPLLAAKIVNQVANSVSIPVTVKTRLGWCKYSSNSVDFALLMQDAGAQLLTIHGRTREEQFSGKADWSAIKKIKAALNIPVIANGDIKTPDDAVKCLATTGADGVMIGRGTMGAPWLIGQIDAAIRGGPPVKTPTPKRKLELALYQLQALVTHKGAHGLLIARKHMSWACKEFDGASDLRNELMRANTPKVAEELLRKKIIELESLYSHNHAKI